MNKKILIPIISVAVIVASAFGVTAYINSASKGMYVETIQLNQTSLVSSVSATGYVQSDEEKNVYSTLGYTIKEVNVEVGDKVNKGDVLCQLDTKSLESAILNAEKSLNNVEVNTDFSISQAEKDYNKMKEQLENGTYQPVSAAEKQVASAKESLDIAEKNYKKKLTEIDSLTESNISAKLSSLKLIESDIKIKRKVLDDIFKDMPDIIKNVYYVDFCEVNRARNAFLVNNSDANKLAYDEAVKEMNKNAVDDEAVNKAWLEIYAVYTRYDAAKVEYDYAVSSAGNAVDSLEDAYNTAKIAYDNAVSNYEIVKRDSETELENLLNSIENDKSTVDYTPEQKNLANLKKDLEDCTVTAPVSGTVTAVYAKEGNAGQGILFIIEDTDKLEVLAKFKEYDIALIEVGMPVVVKSDATGSEKYEGLVSKIAPTSVKDGNSSETEFEVEVEIKSKDTKLMIGMKSKVEITTNEKENVFAVPFDSIRYNDDDEAYVLIAEDNGGENLVVKKIMVSTGIENDDNIEIYGSDLKDGMLVITDSSESITEGNEVSVTK